MPDLDLTEQSFQHWRVLGKGKKTGHGQFWVCQCWGGCVPKTTAEIHADALLEGRATSCGCNYITAHGRRRAIADLVGRQMGKRLVMLRRAGDRQRRKGHSELLYLCRCMCGAEHEVNSFNLTHQQGASCLACAQQKPLLRRWYGDLWVERVIGRGSNRDLRYLCRCVCGNAVERNRSDLVRNHALRCRQCIQPNRGILELHRDEVFSFIVEGVPQKTIAETFGVLRDSVYQFLKRHPEFAALRASLPPTEELVGA